MNAETQPAPKPGKPLPGVDGLPRTEHRDPQSLKAYDLAAQKIVALIAPDTVLDFGYSIGLLVESLRQRRVAATGIDPVEELLDQADRQIRPYLRQAAYTDPLPEERYSLIVSIEALSELSTEEAAAAVQRICGHTDDVVFSARPAVSSDEPGGIKRTPAFWAKLFAKHSFYLDQDFDASFIAPWAARFRRRADLKPEEAIRGYEERFLLLWEENATLRAQVREQKEDIKHLRAENKSVVGALSQWESIWVDLESSLGWKLLVRIRTLLRSLAPPGSRRSSLLRIFRESAARAQREGLGGFFRSLWRGLASLEFFRSPGLKTIEQINAERYLDFVRRTTPGVEELERQRAESNAWSYRPLISFITPVFKPPPEVLQATLDSVFAQSYENWEWCIADASPEQADVRRMLGELAERDPRVRVKFLDRNLGICGNSNEAIAMAAGEFIAILDHDDVLSPSMLYEVVNRIQEKHLADVIYFDEDKLSEDGQEYGDPFFKPDFSPELLISANYLTHAVYRRTLVEEAGRFDPAFEGCQDWDLAFKISEKTRQIEHIPEVLYHWRQVAGSAAGQFGAKNYVFERQLRCVEAHLTRQGLTDVRASFPSPGFLRAVWPVDQRKVSIIIPTKDKVSYLRRTIKSLQRTRYPSYEIVLVDNGSEDKRTQQYYRKLSARPDVRIVEYRERFNYSRANNLGAQAADGEYLLFLNNDVEILDKDWLEEMVRWSARPEVGVVGAKLLYPDGTIQHAGVVVGLEGHASHTFGSYRERQSGPFGSVDWYRNFSAVTGACMMMRRETFQDVGGFDEKYILAFSDIELCLRTIARGFRVVYTPYARLHHFEGKSRGDHIPTHDILAGIDDFKPMIETGDPFYNPNLSYIERSPTIRSADEEDRTSRFRQVTARARVRDRIKE